MNREQAKDTLAEIGRLIEQLRSATCLVTEAEANEAAHMLAGWRMRLPLVLTASGEASFVKTVCDDSMVRADPQIVTFKPPCEAKP